MRFAYNFDPFRNHGGMKIAYRRIRPAFLQVVSEELPAEQLPVAQCNQGRNTMEPRIVRLPPVSEPKHCPIIVVTDILSIEKRPGDSFLVTYQEEHRDEAGHPIRVIVGRHLYHARGMVSIVQKLAGALAEKGVLLDKDEISLLN